MKKKTYLEAIQVTADTAIVKTPANAQLIPPTEFVCRALIWGKNKENFVKNSNILFVLVKIGVDQVLDQSD